LFYFSYLWRIDFLFGVSWFRYLKVYAAIAHHIKGAIMNIHTTLSAARPSNNAGQKLLAGFTDVPVNHNHNK